MISQQQADGVLEAKSPAATDSARAGWLRFFGILLPGALVSFCLLAQLAALGLKGIQPFRTSLDTIVVAALRSPYSARWLVFGDSLTQHVLMDYSLGSPQDVANLTTHAGAGMPSMYLLLRRYLSTHAAPKDILLAMSPEVLANVPSDGDGRFWLTSTFLRPDEQTWLSQFYGSVRSKAWLPAAFDLKAEILDPMTGLVAPRRDRLIDGPDTPSPGLAVEAAEPVSAASQVADGKRAADPIELGSTKPVLTDICHLAQENGIAVHVVVTPMPLSVRAAWQDRGELQRLKADTGALLAKQCGSSASILDLSAVVQPPNFDEGGTHIVGKGWTNRYALALKDVMLRPDQGRE